MKRFNDMKTYAKLALLGGALALAAAPAAAVNHSIAAKAFTKTLPDGSTVPMWGYVPDPDADGNGRGDCFDAADATARLACIDALPDPSLPGPRLTVPPGDTTLNVFLSNGLPEPTSIVITGQEMPFSQTDNGPTWNDGTTGPRAGDLTKRVRSFGREAPADGGRQRYLWNANQGTELSRPGSFIYHSGTHPQKQVYMGLFGSVTKDFAEGEAYPGVTYGGEVLLFYSDIDPDLNAAINELYNPTGSIDPYTTSIGYHPRWFLVNGEPYVPGVTPDIPGGAPDEATLVRFMSAASNTHVPVLQGMRMEIHAEDGLPFTWQDGATVMDTAPTTQYSVMLPPMKTKDAIIIGEAAGTKRAVYDGNGYMTNPSDPNDFTVGDTVGGMLRFLEFGFIVTVEDVPEVHEVLSYGGTQDSVGVVPVISDGGTTVTLDGNAWKQVLLDAPYTVTPDTVLEFDFESGVQGEIHGIGFDDDDALSETRTFQLYGTQTYGIQDFRTYPGTGVVHYAIPVGQFYTGTFDRLFLANDDDANNAGQSIFSNIRIAEVPPPPPPQLTVTVDGVPLALEVEPYDPGQDAGPSTVTVSPDGTTLSMVGNAWKKVLLDCTVGAGTTLDFNFSSSAEGEIHAIGFDTDDAISSGFTFQLFGTQTYGLQNFNNYVAGSGVVAYSIPVGSIYTGTFSRLFFAMDHDVVAPTGESVFSNVVVSGCL